MKKKKFGESCIALCALCVLFVFPSAADAGFFIKANTHAHTKWDSVNKYGSDGTGTMAEMVAAYKTKGYNFLIITDHNSYNGASTGVTKGYFTGRVNPYTPCESLSDPAHNFMCIGGEELTTYTYHAVLFGTTGPWSKFSDTVANFQKAFTAAMNNGGVAIPAHPSASQSQVPGFFKNHDTNWIPDELKSMTYTAMELTGPNSVDWWDQVLSDDLNKKVFGILDDDAHSVKSVGNGWIQAYVAELSKTAVFNAIKTGYFYASTGPAMNSAPFSLHCGDGKTYHMGETAECNGGKFKATVNASAGRHIDNVRIIGKNGSIIYDKTDCPESSSCSIEFAAVFGDPAYYRLEATDSAKKVIYGNPIWVKKNSGACVSRASKKCDAGKLYWYNSCGAKQDLAQDCGVTATTSNYRCDGSWLKRETAQKGCSNNACTSVSVWGNAVDCAASGKTCSNGACATDCSKACVLNAKKCNGNGYQICVAGNGVGSCNVWSPTVNCSASQACSGNGVCNNANPNSNSASQKGSSPSGSATVNIKDNTPEANRIRVSLIQLIRELIAKLQSEQAAIK